MSEKKEQKQPSIYTFNESTPAKGFISENRSPVDKPKLKKDDTSENVQKMNKSPSS